MSAYSAKDLIQHWKNGKIDTTQAIGHILQHLVALSEHDTHVSSRLAALTADVTELAQRVATSNVDAEGEHQTRRKGRGKR